MSYEQVEYTTELVDMYGDSEIIQSWHYEMEQADSDIIELSKHIADHSLDLSRYIKKMETYVKAYTDLANMEPLSNLVYIYGVFDCSPRGEWYEGVIDTDKEILRAGIGRLALEARSKYDLHYTEPSLLMKVYDVIKTEE